MRPYGSHPRLLKQARRSKDKSAAAINQPQAAGQTVIQGG